MAFHSSIMNRAALTHPFRAHYDSQCTALGLFKVQGRQLPITILVP